MIKALLAQAAGLDVAVVVEDGERVPVLEHAGPLVRDAGGGQDVVRTVVFGHKLPWPRPQQRLLGGGLLTEHSWRSVPPFGPALDQSPIDLHVVAGHPCGVEPFLESCRQSRRLRLATCPTARTASSMLSTMKPVTPSVITSGTEPFRQAMTGVPQAIASIITRPNGSGQSMGNSKARALPRNSSFSRPPTSPMYSTHAPDWRSSGSMWS